MKKNCYNCEHLANYTTYEDGYDEGNCCEGRDYKTYEQEKLHLSLLNEESYLSKSKKCCEFIKENYDIKN